MSFLRFVMLLSLIVWVGGLIFFPVVAQTAFSVLPSPHLAGLVVRRSLIVLHWMGIFSGLIFLASSLLNDRLSRGAVHLFATQNILVCVMLLLTLVSQFSIIPRMDMLRAAAGEINSVAASNPIRMEFDALHVWSTRIEGAVLLLGVLVTFLVGRGFSQKM
jgi:Domain of unknown function (DUF4149)